MTAPRRRTWFSKENILFLLGVAIVVFEVVHAEVLGHPFHYEFLIAGLALCGVSITQLADRR